MTELQRQFIGETGVSFDGIPINGVHLEYITWLEAQIQALRQPPVSGSLPPVDPLDDENSEIHKIGREIAEMSDEDFEANCKALEKMLKGSKGNDH